MNKAVMHSLSLVFLIIVLAASGCGVASRDGFQAVDESPAGESVPGAGTPFMASSVSTAIKAGGLSFILKRGWNMVKPALPQAKNFTSATMTWQGQTRLMKDAVPMWTQSQIRYLKGRAWVLLSTASLTAAFQPGGTYYIYSSKNGIVLSFDRPYISDISPGQGEPGDSVTISGVNFGAAQGTSTVTFNGITHTVCAWSDTKIICIAPSYGPVAVTVNGRLSNSEKLFSSVLVEFVTIPGGNYTMGQTGIAEPVHYVNLSDYQIGKYEVTNAQFTAFCAAKPYTAQGDWQNADGSLPGYSTNYPDNPVVCVTWYDAKSFCDFYGYRLPTEAEWEKAARGTDERVYPWGNSRDQDNCNNFEYNGSLLSEMAPIRLYEGEMRGTLPVGSFPSGASPYGAMDMAGNVWEWCNDWADFDEHHPDAPDYNYYLWCFNQGTVINPQGPVNADCARVFRGGSWSGNYTGYIRAAYRDNNAPDTTGDIWGFRVAR